MATDPDKKKSQRARRTFRPRARLMLLLGDELIRDPGIAVFELVKNAYDADASRCRVILDSVITDSPDAKIIVEDNGSGMDLRTIVRVWLQPGTDQRKQQKQEGWRTPRYRRRPLGEKGVGRFAVHKLGSVVRLVTRKQGGKEYVITIDWADFAKGGLLEDIPIKVRARLPKTFPGDEHGTRIEVSSINELPWTRRRVRSLHRAVTSICSPLGGFGRFQARLILKPESDWLNGLLTAREVLDLSVFRFKASLHGPAMSYEYTFTPPTEMERVDHRENEVEGFPLLAESDFRDDEIDLTGPKQVKIPENANGQILCSDRLLD